MTESSEKKTRALSCRKCAEVKEIVFGKRVCNDCVRAAARQYAAKRRASPEWAQHGRERHREWQSKYTKTPEYRARRAQRRKDPERAAVKKAWQVKYGPAATAKYEKSEKGRANKKAYFQRPEVRAKERLRAQSAHYKEYQRAYRKSEKGRACDANKRHRRRTVEKSGSVSTSQFLNLKKSATHCRYCGARFRNGVVKSVDHVTPLSKGGTHSMDNLVVCCRSCNCKKKDRSPDEWALEIGLLLI